MHTDTETLYMRVVDILRAHDRSDITGAEAEQMIDTEAAFCALHDGGDEAA